MCIADREFCQRRIERIGRTAPQNMLSDRRRKHDLERHAGRWLRPIPHPTGHMVRATFVDITLQLWRECQCWPTGQWSHYKVIAFVLRQRCREFGLEPVTCVADSKLF